MIPDDKQSAVRKGLRAAFETDEFEDIQQITKGLSGALVFKIVVGGKPFLLRVVTRTDAFGDPTFYYGCMKTAAENEIAPRIHYLSIEDRISITDFIVERPFSVSQAKETMPRLIRKLHAMPKLPFRLNYFESMDNLLPQFRAAAIFPENEVKDVLAINERIAAVYPRNDVENWVSSHNDSKPDNIVFDGQRPWFVDWESAFLNDRYLDLAMVANFVVMDEKDEVDYLEAYFEEAADERRRARFFLMRQILHFNYFMFLTAFDQGAKPIDLSSVNEHDFREFHDRLWNGRISLADNENKREYALVHLRRFQSNAQTERFAESLRVVSEFTKS